MNVKKRINLALQGGGAHGAFTWGVLDRFLEEEDLEIAAITGTSAGALNGAAFKAGIAHGGRDRAKHCLDQLWQRMGALRDQRMHQWFAGVDAAALIDLFERLVPYTPMDMMSQLSSPYHLGPFYKNPLQAVVETFNFEEVCCDDGPALFVCATSVRTGKVRIFKKHEISTQAILASACLPSLFQAVEIEDPKTQRVEAYWDGGYSGNPALFPLFNKQFPSDVLVVNINPLERDIIPKSPQEIQNRVNEISFNSSLLRELRAISFVQRLLENGTLKRGDMQEVFVHMVADDEMMRKLSVTTKMVPVPQILNRLKEAGRKRADHFLANHKQDIGNRSTVDLEAMFN
ncbi:patatin-like phospholipase family protein [Epibacterium ulvae]|uniref:patatin-like phospholipase family protein n=1 Tax=Epibacterium ulvae TaxID=1156985 RepID=UPI002490E433|nr:patatin-like phospholipase family protein [Epibacterium ulvae]